MPTQRFFNLPDEKRKKIKRAAIEEFSKFTFADVSINQIIKTADISRGSFYTYFNDKEDLLSYLFRDIRVTCKDWFFQNMDLCQGNIYQVLWNAITELVDHGREYQDFEFYKNIFLNTKLTNNTELIGYKGFFHQNQEYQEMVSSCYDKIDHLICPVKNREELSYLLELLFFLVVISMTMYYRDSANKEQIFNVMKNQFEIIEEGVRTKIKSRLDKKE